MGITRTLERIGKMVAEQQKPVIIRYVCWRCGREYQRKPPTYPVCKHCGGEISPVEAIVAGATIEAEVLDE